MKTHKNLVKNVRVYEKLKDLFEQIKNYFSNKKIQGIKDRN